MIQALISLVIWLLIIGVIFWAVRYIASTLPMDPVVRNVINVVLTVVTVVVVLIVLLNLLGVMTGVSLPRMVPQS